MPSLIMCVSSKLSAVVVMKHAIVPSKAPIIIGSEKPSFEASGIQTPACKAVIKVHMMISTVEFLLQDAIRKMHSV